MDIKRYFLTAVTLMAAVCTSMAAPPQDVTDSHGKFGRQVVARQGKTAATTTHTGMISRWRKTAMQAPPKQARRKFGQMRTPPAPATVARRLGAKSAPGTNLTIYGSMLYSSTWTEDLPEYGVYSFRTDEYSPARLNESDIAVAAGGGTLVGDRYYTVDLEDFYGIIFCYLTVYDTETFKQLDYSYVDPQSSALDMTYDPVTDNVYGTFVNDAQSGYVWGTLNLETGARTTIESFDVPMICVACNQLGVCYGIDPYGDFFQIDKATGKPTKIGATGVKPEPCTQSATFDPATGALYWAACLDDGTSALYTVNTATGVAQMVESFPGGEQYTGLMIKKPLAAQGAPAQVDNLTATFSDGSATGTISFTMPQTTFGGQQLEGTLTYIIKADGQALAQAEAEAGAAVSAEVTSPAGLVKFEVTAANAEGEGPVAETTVFVGKDTPDAVAGIKLEVTDAATHRITLSWSAPQSTVNGGWLDTENLTYDVVRMPGGISVATGLKATTFTEEVPVEQLALYYYTVTPHTGGLAGQTALSERIKLGEYCTVPYLETFSDPNALELFTIVNPHGDYTWEYYYSYVAGQGTASCNYDYNNPKDDWLITPPIRLEPGYTYKLQFDTYSKRVYPETFEVKMGREATAEAMTTTIVKDTTMTTTEMVPDVIGNFERDITVDESGSYHIGFHAKSEAHMLRLELTNISVTLISANSAPARVTNLKATAAGRGELKATLTFNAPEENISGGKVDRLEKIDILAGNELLKTIGNPVPGQEQTAEVPAVQGDNTYTVIAYSEAGAGLDAKVTVYAGVSKPEPVTNAKVIEQDGKAVITWDAPQAGADGGYIDPAKLDYVIVRGSDMEIVADGITGTTFTDSPDIKGTQQIMVYVIYAASAAGMGGSAMTNPIVMGDSYYTVPFAETFKDCAITTVPWCLASPGESSWWLTKDGTVNSQDGDGGLIYFIADNPSESSDAISPKISLANTATPTLKFYYWYNDNVKGNQRLDIRATTDYNDFTTLKTIDFSNVNERPGWVCASVPLKDYVDRPFVALSFLATAAAGNNGCIYIDNISIIDECANNLTLTGFTAPSLIETGTQGTFTAKVRNDGQAVANGYTMELWQDSKIAKTVEGEPMVPGSEMIYTFKVEANPANDVGGMYHAQINFEADQNQGNNRSEDLRVDTYIPSWPTATALTGQNTGKGMELNWDAPAGWQRTKPLTDSFEDYKTFSIAFEMGDWRMVDVDGSPTYGITYQGHALQYANAGAKMAYQVFSAKEADIDQAATGVDVFEAHSGHKVMAAFPDTDGSNDDWLISPELDGTEQVVTFYAKTTLPQYGFDEVEFLVSDKGTDIADFVKLEGVGGSVPYEWTRYAAVIPAGTRHFAVRCVSKATYLFLVDDITFAPLSGEKEQLAVVGYNVYRDGVLITPQPVTATSYTDTGVTAGRHEYRVSVVYAQGESACTEALTTDVSTGIDRNAAAGVSVSAGQGHIIISNAAGQAVSVSTAGGAVLYAGTPASQRLAINTAAGMHMIKIGNNVWKVMVE